MLSHSKNHYVGVQKSSITLNQSYERGLETAVGDEGGFAPRFEGTEDAVETIIKAIEKQDTNQVKMYS